MAIPEKQLEIWSKQGATQSSARTYDSIKTCIEGHHWNDDVEHKTYLQGSYKNSTNIYGNSDVDIIVELLNTFRGDTSNLDDTGKAIYESFPPAKYTLADFKKAVINRLKKCYEEQNVVVGNKSIKVIGNGSRLDADVVVCNSYRRYKKNFGSRSLSWVDGIIFNEENTGKTIINYPSPHYDHGVSKNDYARTYNNLKKVTRIFKNMKASLVDHNAMSSKSAPSYFVECLIYNAIDEHFRKANFTDIVIPIMDQFVKDYESGQVDKYVCQNEQRLLFGNGDQQWNKDDAREYIKKLIYVWKNYPI